MPYQRGAGMGSFLKGLFKMAVPLLRKAAPILGKHALSTAINAISDLQGSEDFLPTMTKRARQQLGGAAEEIGKRVQSGGKLGGIPRQKTIKGVKKLKRKPLPRQEFM